VDKCQYKLGFLGTLYIPVHHSNKLAVKSPAIHVTCLNQNLLFCFSAFREISFGILSLLISPIATFFCNGKQFCCYSLLTWSNVCGPDSPMRESCAVHEPKTTHRSHPRCSADQVTATITQHHRVSKRSANRRDVEKSSHSKSWKFFTSRKFRDQKYF